MFNQAVRFLIVSCLAVSLSCDGGKNETSGSAKEKEDTVQPSQQNDQMARPLAGTKASDRADYFSSEPAMTIDDSKTYVATVHTEKGDIVMELDPLYAPHHVNNFVFLAKQGFYDGLTFHRVEPNFVVQGGDPLGAGSGGPGYTIPAEVGLQHIQGAVAMARLPDQVNPEKRSSGSQFYITLQATPFLDGNYSVFGKVVQGFDVVQKIAIGDMITRVDVEERTSQ